MTVAQGRPCLQGLEWSSICGPEAGSVPTVPWQENVQPSQSRQLGYSQGAMENWRAAVPCWSWGSSEEEGKGWWVRNKVFYIILVLQGHGICRVQWAKPNVGWWRGPHVCVDLRWLNLSSGRYVRRGLAAILTTFTHSEGVSLCRHCNTLLWWWWIFKVWNWIIHLSL